MTTNNFCVRVKATNLATGEILEKYSDSTNAKVVARELIQRFRDWEDKDSIKVAITITDEVERK